MSKWALIYQGRVIDLDDRDNPTPPTLAGARWVPGKVGAKVGWDVADDIVKEPPSPLSERRLSFTTFVERLTDDELDLLLDNKASGPLRHNLYRWEIAGTINPDAPQVQNAVRAIFGVQRASQLLA